MSDTARIFETSTGGQYHICDDDLPYLDASGAGYANKRQALHGAYRSGYTHAIGSGTYRSGARITTQCPSARYWQQEHEQARLSMSTET